MNKKIKQYLLAFAALSATLALPFFAGAQQQTAPQQPAPVPIGSINFDNVSLTQVVDLLAKQLNLNIIPDTRMKGSVTVNTYGDTSKMDARNVLDLILRINGYGLVQEGELWRVIPMSDVARHNVRMEVNAKNIPDDDQLMLNMVFLKYITVAELMEVLKNFTGENAVLYPYPPANLLFILDSRRAMRRTMEIISQFDSDTFTGERVRLYELKDTRPSEMQKELENVLKAIAFDAKSSTVRFLPIDRINTLIGIAQNPGIFDTVESWIKKLDVPIAVTSGSSDTYVYRVRYQRADCLAMALTQLYLPLYFGGGMGGGYGGGYGGIGGYGGLGGGYAPGAIPYGGGGNYGAFGAYGAGAFGGGMGGGGMQNGGYGSTNAFASGVGGSGGCYQGMAGGGGYGAGMGMGMGMGGGYPGGGGGFGYPAFGGYAAQVPQAGLTGIPQTAGAQGQQAATTTTPTGPPPKDPPRIVPNPMDNSLLIQADQAQYQGILKLLKELDIPPRQILLEARIYQVDMSGAFSSGVTAYFQQRTGSERRPLASLTGAITQFSVGALVSQSRELLAFLKLQENATRAHVVSEPSLIATDSIPATINVGTQVPVLTSQVASPVQVGGTNTINQQIAGRNTGVTLNVNARVNPSGVVTLTVNQEISRPAGASSNTLTPSFAQQVVQTQLTVQDGDTVAIGGIIAENGSETSSGIPLLHRIPVLGAAFGSREYSRSRSEFIIFMTPHVIYDTNDLMEASDELIGRVKKLRKYMKPL